MKGSFKFAFYILSAISVLAILIALFMIEIAGETPQAMSLLFYSVPVFLISFAIMYHDMKKYGCIRPAKPREAVLPYGTPEAFKKTWPKKQPAINITKYSIATVIANNGLTLRKAKGKNLCGNRITAIPKNSKITILKKSAETQRINGVNYTMAKIQYNTYTGYVAQQYLKF